MDGLKVETKIKLNKFHPRSYQLPIIDALENKGYKRVIAIWPRRAGKDVVAFNLILRAALRQVGVYYYVFPTYSQAKKVIWDSMTNSGERFIDYIPKEIIKNCNSQEMKVKLANESLIQLVGSDNIDSLVGTNPRGIVFSEYALQDPRAYQFLRPILLANNGWAMFVSTPRGKNSFWDLYQVAINSDDWYASKLTVVDTGHISLHEIAKEEAEGLMSPDLIQQEYYTSFELGVEGAYYAKYIDKLHLKGQIGTVPWEPGFKVHTAWDIGSRDNTSIVFFQVIGATIHIIDAYEKNKEGLEHYIKVINSKPYNYGTHIAPHDMAQVEFTTGMSRVEKARELGINFQISPKLGVEDGIEAVRTTLPRCWFDETNCKQLIRALENYRQEYDPKHRIYKQNPLHDIYSHYADAFRYMAVTIPTMQQCRTADDLERAYNEARYGIDSSLPPFFR